MDKQSILARLEEIEKRWANCEECGLSEERNSVVQWRGSPWANLCAIGEAPGAEEDKIGRPFVGRAGRALDGLLIKAGVDPANSIFIMNMVACRPPQNRVPTHDEINACGHRRDLLLSTVNPKVLLLVGGTAARRLAGITVISKWRGQPIEVELVIHNEIVTYPAVATFHPSYLIRMGSNKEIAKCMIGDITLAKELADGQ